VAELIGGLSSRLQS